MNILITGSSGRIGRAIFGALAGAGHRVIGLDHAPFATTHFIGDCADRDLLARAMEGVDAVVHAAGPHAPHVGMVPDAEFERVNVEGTFAVFDEARAAGARAFIYTSTTALYGDAIDPGACTFVTEETPPQPRTIYHRTKLAAETLLEEIATDDMPVRALRMSRCFPEPAPEMGAYRLHRGIDARDVAEAHRLALADAHRGRPFERFVLSGATPFGPEDCPALASDAAAVIRDREPALADAFDARGWALPRSIDRIYSPTLAQQRLGWQPRWDWREVLAQADRHDLEVLPAAARVVRKSE